MRKILNLTLLIILIFMPTSTVFAQDPTPQPDGPIYIVESGDNLTSIANRFGITNNQLLAANDIADPNSLKVGDQLIIPGMPGIKGYLLTQAVDFGNTLDLLSIKNQVLKSFLVKLNHITSPAELYAGVNLIIPQQNQDNSTLSKHYLVGSDQSLLEFAALAGVNPWQLAAENQLQGNWDTIAGQTIYLPISDNAGNKALENSPLDNVSISPLPMVQGKTISIEVNSPVPVTLSGSLTGHSLNFFSEGENKYVALQGIYAMQDPGIYPLHIEAKLQDGTSVSNEQMVIIQDGYYPKDPVINVQEEFVDPKITQPELDWLTALTLPSTPEKQWKDIWVSPSPYLYTDCLNSRFGNRRSYNGGPFNNFHSGVDFCGGEGVKIFAPAAGTVIFAGEKTVRGNMTVIDHGWGVYSGIFHQSKIEVNVGDHVDAGQEIGLVGGTGRVTGAHLHWEVWVGNVQVDPLDWLKKVIPPEN
jgi:murein DD-endopeptidase MepM/ murein hydrolase activator NlpD